MKSRLLTFNGLHGVISQKVEVFIITAVRTSDPTLKLYLTTLTYRWLVIDLRVCSLLRERVFGEPLASNGLPLGLHYSGIEASCHNNLWGTMKDKIGLLLSPLCVQFVFTVLTMLHEREAHEMLSASDSQNVRRCNLGQQRSD
jgi:hypothetical protein